MVSLYDFVYLVHKLPAYKPVNSAAGGRSGGMTWIIQFKAITITELLHCSSGELMPQSTT